MAIEKEGADGPALAAGIGGGPIYFEDGACDRCAESRAGN